MILGKKRSDIFIVPNKKLARSIDDTTNFHTYLYLSSQLMRESAEVGEAVEVNTIIEHNFRVE